MLHREAARLLGIHFVALKKWIYAEKISTTKTLGKQHLVPESETKRILGQLHQKCSGDLRKGFIGRPER